jgi:formiminoglutamase
LIGVPEDIGVRANYGRAGAAAAYQDFLRYFVGLPMPQSAKWNHISCLGEVQLDDLMQRSSQLDMQSLEDGQTMSELVKETDQRVQSVIDYILKEDVVPIVIGGGHNNVLPILRAVKKKLGDPVNVINIDAHTDLRSTSGRHSGNGFSYGFAEGLIDKYHLLGLQEMYLTDAMRNTMAENRVSYTTLQQMNQTKALNDCSDFISQPFILEIDMDVVADFPSSAQNPNGLTLQKLLATCDNLLKGKKPLSIHICEAAPKYGYAGQTAKALQHLVYTLIN